MKNSILLKINKFVLSADPLDSFAEEGEVLRQLHHGDNGHAPNHHTGGPKERVEQHIGAVKFGENDILLNSFRVIKTREVLVFSEVLYDNIHK